ncbi:MAG: YetF domain-containing protein [Pyrinomonadaceae bacterium]
MLQATLWWNTEVWRGVFQLPMPVIEKILRSMLVYFALVVLLRIFGKRELAQLNPFDLVVLLSLSNTVQNAFIGDDNSITGGLLGAFTLLLTNYIVVRFVLRHRRLDQLFEGTPTVLIENGELCERAMARELLTEAELTTVAHRQGFRNLEHVQTCVLEPGGTFYIEGKEQASAVTTRELSGETSQILERFDAISRELEAIRRELAGRS